MPENEYRPMSDAPTPRSRPSRRSALACAPLSCSILLLAAAPASAQDVTDFASISLDSLLSIPVHSAARYAQAMSEAPAAVTVVTAEQIAAFGYRTLDQILARAAGFHVSYDRNYAYVGVRGFSRPTDYNNRVLLLLNGHPVNETVYGGAPIGDELGLDLSLLERVEIVRGPVSALYGTSAMFAVVNLITAQPSGSGVAVAGTAGGAGYLQASGRIHSSPSLDRAFLFSTEIAREDGLDLFYPEYAENGHDGVARGRDWSRSVSTFASARLGDLSVHGRFAHREKGVPTGAWETTFDQPDSRTVDRWGQLAGNYDRTLRPALLLSAGFAADYYAYRGWYPDEDGKYKDATDAIRFSTSTQTAWDVSARNRLVSGVTLSHSPRGDYRGGYDGELDFDADRRVTTVGLYVQDEMHVRPWITLIGGGRIDAESDTDTRVTPRASAIVRPAAGTTLKLLYGMAFRSPNLYERTTYADAGGVVGLDAEQIHTYEVVAEQRLARSATLRLSLFHDQVDDLIDVIEDPASMDGFTFANVGQARTQGLEGEFTVTAGGWLVQGAGILQSAIDRGTGERLTNAPARIFRIGGHGALPYRLHAAGQLRTESGRVTLAGNETAAFGVVDLSLAHRPASHMRVSAAVTNALDASYAHPAGIEHRQDTIAQDGRRVRLRMEFAW